jgi:hypothetical protein
VLPANRTGQQRTVLEVRARPVMAMPTAAADRPVSPDLRAMREAGRRRLPPA